MSKVVTWLQAVKMQKGLTGVCVLACPSQTSVLPVDIGIDGEPIDNMLSLKLSLGCGNIAQEPAMSRQDAEHLLLASASLVKKRAQEGISVFGVGELGIANTTPASAIISVLTDSDPHDVMGIGQICRRTGCSIRRPLSGRRYALTSRMRVMRLMCWPKSAGMTRWA